MIHCRVQALLETNLGVDPETVDGQPISQPISHSISQSISQPISARVPTWRLQSPDLPRHLVLLIILGAFLALCALFGAFALSLT